MESVALDLDSEPEVDLDEEDLEKLESDVTQMAQKISDYRQTLPDHLRDTLDSALSSQRPVFSNIRSGSDLLPSSRQTIAVPVALGPEEGDCEEKMIQLKERMSRNAAKIPRVVKRVRECTERIDKLDSFNGTIHPAFTRRRIN